VPGPTGTGLCTLKAAFAFDALLRVGDVVLRAQPHEVGVAIVFETDNGRTQPDNGNKQHGDDGNGDWLHGGSLTRGMQRQGAPGGSPVARGAESGASSPLARWKAKALSGPRVGFGKAPERAGRIPATIREIVEKVVIHPRGPYKPVEIEIYGQLAALLRISERAAEPLESRGVLVAGIGLNLMTFWL
jgi:hypothetical protein